MDVMDLRPEDGRDRYFHTKFMCIYEKGMGEFTRGYVPIVWYKGKYRIVSPDGETIPYLETEEGALNKARKAFMRLAERDVKDNQIYKGSDIYKNALTD